MRVTRIVSGGQTGADRGGLDAAIELGIEHGGWCPKGRRAEDGRIPDRYHLDEMPTAIYAARTARNVTDSDGTVVVTRGAPSGGTALTVELASKYSKPCLVIDLDSVTLDRAVRDVRSWLAAEAIAVLNVAGPRESKAAGIAAETRALLLRALAPE